MKTTVNLGDVVKRVNHVEGREINPSGLKDLAQSMIQFANMRELFEEAEMLGTTVNLSPRVFIDLTKVVALTLSNATAALTKEYEMQKKSTVVELDMNPTNYPIEIDILPIGVAECRYN